LVRTTPTLLLGFLGALSIFTDGWSKLFVPTGHPSFGDLRSITSTAECFAENPNWSYSSASCDPWQRKFNYPIIWLKTFSLLGLKQSHTFALGVVLFFILLSSLLYWNLRIIRARFDWWQVASLAAIYISPPILLLVERGNSDSLIFALFTLVTLVSKRISPLFVATLLAFLSYLKLFVMGAMFMVLCMERKWYFRLLYIGLFAILLVSLKEQLPYIRSFTAIKFWTSFGISVAPLGFALFTGAEISIIQSLAIGLILIVVVMLILLLALSKHYKELTSLDNLNLEEIRIVSMYFGVLLFSFLAGSSYDYRLVFLIPIMLLTTLENSCMEWKKAFAVMMISVMYISRLGIYSIVGDLLFTILLSHLFFIYAALLPRLSKSFKTSSTAD